MEQPLDSHASNDTSALIREVGVSLSAGKIVDGCIRRAAEAWRRREELEGA